MTSLVWLNLLFTTKDNYYFIFCIRSIVFKDGLKINFLLIIFFFFFNIVCLESGVPSVMKQISAVLYILNAYIWYVGIF